MHTGARSVLVVAFRFPPHGGGGVHRPAHFVHHLPAFGWRPHVLTGPEDGRRHVRDRSLLELVEDVPVTRTGYLEVDRAYRALGKLRLATAARICTPWLPNLQPGWIPYGWWEGRRLLERRDFDLIYSSAYPISCHVVAGLLARSSGLPWVADYRDEWSIREVVSWPTPAHRALAGWMDRRITSSADRVVTTSPAHTRRFAAAFGGPASKYVTITNGFDARDFPDAGEEGARRRGDVFTVAHVGTLFTWRGADPLLEAVRRVLDDEVLPEDRLRVRLVGYAPEVGFEDLKRQGVLRVTGYVDHDSAVAEMRSADVLFLVNTERTNIPAKTFEYLASGRPVLAAVRPGPTADLIRDRTAGTVVRPDDVADVERALRRMIAAWKDGRLPKGASRRDVGDLTRRELTRRLASVFREVFRTSRRDRDADMPHRDRPEAGRPPGSARPATSPPPGSPPPQEDP